MTSTYPSIRDHFVSTDPTLWTRPHEWTVAEALSGPGRTEKRRELFEANSPADRLFLAGLPDNTARVIAINNVFGPNLLPEDIAEFLAEVFGYRMDAEQVKAALDGAPTDVLDEPGSSGAEASAVDRARESLVAAQAASTKIMWSGGSGSYTYAEPLAALRDAQVASGQATLAVAEELAASRAEAGQVAAAVRELTSTLSSVLGEVGARVTAAECTVDEHAETIGTALWDITYDVRALRDGGSIDDAVDELRDIASALSALADRADRPRWWQWRLRRARARAERAAEPAEPASIELVEPEWEALA